MTQRDSGVAGSDDNNKALSLLPTATDAVSAAAMRARDADRDSPGTMVCRAVTRR